MPTSEEPEAPTSDKPEQPDPDTDDAPVAQRKPEDLLTFLGNVDINGVENPGADGNAKQLGMKRFKLQEALINTDAEIEANDYAKCVELALTYLFGQSDVKGMNNRQAHLLDELINSADMETLGRELAAVAFEQKEVVTISQSQTA